MAKCLIINALDWLRCFCQSEPSKKNHDIGMTMNYLKTLCLAVALTVMIPCGVSPAIAQSEEAEEDKDGKAARAKSKYVSLEPAFVTNFLDERLRYFRTDITIRASDDATEEAIRKHEFAVRHVLVMLFSRQTEDTFMSAEGRQTLQSDATSEVINLLNSENAASEVQNVLFTTFVVE
jgi:flagellar FliL protein